MHTNDLINALAHACGAQAATSAGAAHSMGAFCCSLASMAEYGLAGAAIVLAAAPCRHLAAPAAILAIRSVAGARHRGLRLARACAHAAVDGLALHAMAHGQHTEGCTVRMSDGRLATEWRGVR